MSTRGHGFRRGGLRAVAMGAALALAATTPALSAPPAGAAPPPAATAEIESLEAPGLSGSFAHLDVRTTAREQPDAAATPVAPLGLKTQDGTDELVGVIARTTDASGGEWLRVRLPVRPNGTTGWIPRSAVGEIRRVDAWLTVDRRSLRATLVRHGRIVFRAPIGIGQARWPTPRGTFYVRDRLDGPALGATYGPLAFGTSASSAVLTDWPGGGVIGIHGTDQPERLPGRVSHGCIRLRNADILRLGRQLTVGTPITVV